MSTTHRHLQRAMFAFMQTRYTDKQRYQCLMEPEIAPGMRADILLRDRERDIRFFHELKVTGKSQAYRYFKPENIEIFDDQWGKGKWSVHVTFWNPCYNVIWPDIPRECQTSITGDLTDTKMIHILEKMTGNAVPQHILYKAA